MASVTLESVSKTYNSREGVVHAVDDVDLEVRDEEFVVLVGPSGCGKSTTLRLIAGLERVSSGVIRIDGRDVTGAAPKDRDIAMVFQNYALYPHMTVYANISFPLRMRKISKPEQKRRVHWAAGVLELEDYLQRYPRQLSGGQRQRVAMGRALVREPAAFLLDEPLSNLDAQLRVQMRTELRALHDRLQTTIVYVTHDQVEAMTLADRIVVMRDGNIEQIGTPEVVYDQPSNTFVAGFIGSPAMNLLPGHLRRRDGKVSVEFSGGGRIELEATPSGEDGIPVVYGIRPENLRLSAERDGLLPLDFALRPIEKLTR